MWAIDMLLMSPMSIGRKRPTKKMNDHGPRYRHHGKRIVSWRIKLSSAIRRRKKVCLPLDATWRCFSRVSKKAPTTNQHDKERGEHGYEGWMGRHCYFGSTARRTIPTLKTESSEPAILNTRVKGVGQYAIVRRGQNVPSPLHDQYRPDPNRQKPR